MACQAGVVQAGLSVHGLGSPELLLHFISMSFMGINDAADEQSQSTDGLNSPSSKETCEILQKSQGQFLLQHLDGDAVSRGAQPKRCS